MLAWIKNKTKVFGAFVRDKVGKIHSASLPDQWRYIPSNINPADILTHKMNIEELMRSETWLVGPKFLSSLELNEFKHITNPKKSLIKNRVSGECLESTNLFDPLNGPSSSDSHVFFNFALNPERFSS